MKTPKRLEISDSLDLAKEKFEALFGERTNVIRNYHIERNLLINKIEMLDKEMSEYEKSFATKLGEIIPNWEKIL